MSDENYVRDRKQCEAIAFETPREYTTLERKTFLGINDRDPRVVKVESLYQLTNHAVNGGDTKEKPAWGLLMEISKEVSACMSRKGWELSSQDAVKNNAK